MSGSLRTHSCKKWKDTQLLLMRETQKNENPFYTYWIGFQSHIMPSSEKK